MVLPKLYGQPIIDNRIIQSWTGFTRPGAQKLIERFIQLGILEKKDKDTEHYIYTKYVNIFMD
jgi:hypothetical protein